MVRNRRHHFDDNDSWQVLAETDASHPAAAISAKGGNYPDAIAARTAWHGMATKDSAFFDATADLQSA
ncbi:MAG: hypothetical protein AAF790_02825 [Planctomycetota bacterium]